MFEQNEQVEQQIRHFVLEKAIVVILRFNDNFDSLLPHFLRDLIDPPLEKAAGIRFVRRVQFTLADHIFLKVIQERRLAGTCVSNFRLAIFSPKQVSAPV